MFKFTRSKSMLISLVLIGVVLLGFRISLPYLLIYYAEKTINKIPEYQAKIEDIDVQLFRGSYIIKNIALNKINKKIPVPFFSSEKVRLSVDWNSLFHGAFVAQINAYKPQLNFVIEPNKKNEQVTIDSEWENAVKALFPLNFNKVTINQGTIALHSFKGKPPYHLILENIDFKLDNLEKVSSKRSLFSTFVGTGLMNKGSFMVEGRIDPFAKKPTFLLKSSLKNMKIEGANDFLLNMVHLDVSKGDFSLYSELEAKQGLVSGYAKPIIKNLKILDPKKKINPVKLVYKSVVAVGAQILTNQQKHTIATKVRIKGSIEDPQTSLLSIIGYILRNAFIEALLPQLDNQIKMKDIVLEKATRF